MKQERDIKKQIAKDTVDTLKQQKEEEKEKEVDIKVEENVFSKEWWKSLLSEEDVTQAFEEASWQGA